MAHEVERREFDTAALFRLNWSAIWGGLFVATGLWLLLHMLGLAVGFSTVNPTNPESLRSVGIGSIVWSIIVSIGALLVGGLVAGRTAGPLSRLGGAAHGFVLWGFVTLAGVVMMALVITSAARGAVGMGAAAGRAAAEAGQVLGMDASALIGPVNDELRRQGRPTVTAEGLRTAMGEAAPTSITQGRFDRDTFARSLERNNALRREDSMAVSGIVERQLGSIPRGLEQAADVTRAVFWGMFVSQLLSLAAAVFGAIIGVSRRQRATAAVIVRPEVPITASPGEVYP